MLRPISPISLFNVTVVFTNKRSQAKVYTVLCILGLVAYRQYIHHCSSQVDPHLAHGGESSIRSSAPLAWLCPPSWPPLQLSAPAPG